MDLANYTSVLPYASELFGVYQPMIGWKSKRMLNRLKAGLLATQSSLLRTFAEGYQGAASVTFDTDIDTDQCAANILNVEIAKPIPLQALLKDNQSVLIQCLNKHLPSHDALTGEEWKELINEDT